MAHSGCGWTCGCAGKTVKSLENTCHTWALMRWWFATKRRYIKCMHLYPTSTLPSCTPFRPRLGVRHGTDRRTDNNNQCIMLPLYGGGAGTTICVNRCRWESDGDAQS